MKFSATENTVTIAGPVGSLEAVVSRPTQDDGCHGIAIVCHPHPLYSGTMTNKVVTTLVRAYTEVGFWAVRFNFRGVGKSAGSYGQGVGELEDLKAVYDWCNREFPGYAVGIAGFSFGAFIAASLTAQYSVSHLITVAPPVPHFDFIKLKAIQCPWLLIQGDEDEVVPAEQVLAWAKSLSHPPHIVELAGATHFFHGRLVELKAHVINFLKVICAKINKE